MLKWKTLLNHIVCTFIFDIRNQGFLVIKIIIKYVYIKMSQKETSPIGHPIGHTIGQNWIKEKKRKNEKFKVFINKSEKTYGN